MIINKVPGLVICLSIILAFNSKVYSQVQDAGLWANIQLEKKFTQKFSLTLNNEARFIENVSELGTFFSDAGINYKIIPTLNFGANYRISHKKRLDDSFSRRHRYYFDLTYKALKIKQFEVSLRGRYQSQYSDLNVSEDGLIPSNYLRSRIGFKYSPEKKYKPYLTVEAFYPLNNKRSLFIDNLRGTLGMNYELNKSSNLNLFYLVQRELNVNNPTEDYVVGLGYEYTF